jgi:hypothetical protein
LFSRMAQIDGLGQSRPPLLLPEGVDRDASPPSGRALVHAIRHLTICLIETACPTVFARMWPSKRALPRSFRRLHITK